MKRIGLITNITKDITGEKTSEIIDYIYSFGMDVLVTHDIYSLVNKGTRVSADSIYRESSLILTLGGDGTLLQSARKSAITKKPIMGINLGNLGFLTDNDFKHAKEVIEAIALDEYHIENRMMLEATLIRKDNVVKQYIALNDIGITKAMVSRIIKLKASINDNVIGSYKGDGLIIASPTGSTAYSLSAGGPIVNPSLECLLLTPICPHTLNGRTIMTSSNDMIEIELECKERDIGLMADGKHEIILDEGDKIQIRKSKYFVELMRTSRINFFDLLNEKINFSL